tara:strand:- start:193 stop:345 length:153 start_codon:yes stop_codon:yes gene_type:complete
MGPTLAQRGAKFKVIANDIFNKAKEIKNKILIMDMSFNINAEIYRYNKWL